MTPDLWIQIIAALAPTLMALAALIASMKNSTSIKEVHLSVNSRMDELLIASRSQGARDARDEQAATDAKALAIANALKISTADIAHDLKTNTADIAANVKVNTADIASNLTKK